MFSDQAKKGWNPARQHCESMGMTLATLDQPAAAYLASLRLLDWYTEAGETDFWIGLWDARILDHSQSGYRWVDDCSSLANGSWMGWESEEPLNTDDHFCVGANMNTAACDNVDLGYDAVNKIHRSPCFSFQFNLAAMADDTGSTTPEGVSCPDFVMFTENAKTGWNPAKQHCESLGMKLATLDQTANDYIISLMSESWYQDYG
nr:hypothetical protein BaRGS_021432 [Batillaria attramentaria]